MHKFLRPLLIALFFIPFLALLRHILLGVAEWTPPMTWSSALFTVDQGNTQFRNNFEWLFAPNVDVVELDEADKTTTSTTFVDIDAAGDPDLSLSIETFGEDVVVDFSGMVGIITSSASTSVPSAVNFDIAVDGVRDGGDDGYGGVWFHESHATADDIIALVTLRRRISGLAAGVHTFTLQWKCAGNGTPTATLYCGGGTGSSRDVHPTMWVTKG